MNSTLRAIGLAIIALAAPVLSGQVTFTFNTTANSNAGGFVNGSQYTFNFVTGTDIGSAYDPTNNFTATRTNWIEEEPSDTPVVTAFSGGGISGTLQRTSDPYANLTISDGFNDAVIIFVGSDASEDTGLFTPDISPIRQINIRFGEGDMPAFVYPGTYVDPTTYFSDYVGTYVPSLTNQNFTLDDDTFSLVGDFTINSVTISVTPVPEPSTYAAIGGLAALLVACNRRRRRA